MKRKALLLTLVLALALGVVGVAYAGPRGSGGSGRIEKAVEDLGLTDQQLSQLRSIHQETYDKTRDLRIRLMDAMFSLRQLKLQRNPDQAAIDAKVKEVDEIRAKLQEFAQDARQQVESILTQEQKDKIGSFCGSRPGRFGRGAWRFGAPGPSQPQGAANQT